MNNINNLTKKKETKFIKDPFYDLIKEMYHPIYFNIIIPKGEYNFINQPISKNEVKQEKN